MIDIRDSDIFGGGMAYVSNQCKEIYCKNVLLYSTLLAFYLSRTLS